MPSLIGPSGTDELQRARSTLNTQNIYFFFHAPAVQGIAEIGTDVVGATVNGYVAGAYQVSTAAVVNSAFRMTSAAFASSFPQAFATGADWFASARFRIDSDWDNTTENYIGLADAGGTAPLRIGIHGPSSIVNFVMQGPSGTLMDSGIAIDKSLHTLRGWNVGGVSTLEIDDVQVATGNVTTTGATCPVWMCKTGALAVRQSSIKWWCGASVMS